MYHYPSRKKTSKIKKRFFLISLISVIPFILIILFTFSGWEKITQMDYQISHYFYALHSVGLTKIMTIITHLGDVVTQTLVTVLIVFILFILKKWRIGLWYGLTVLGGALFLNGAIKELYARARPSQIDPLVQIGGYSFPSGHSMGAIIVYGGLLFLIVNLVHSSRFTLFLTVIFSFMILAIGISRLYLAVHFPTDVIGGFSLGLSWLSLSIALFGLNYTSLEFQPKNPYSIKNL